MNSISQFWQNISDIGLAPTFPPIEKLKIRFLNRITFITIAFGLLAIIIFYSIYNSSQLLLTALWLIMTLSISIYFAYAQKHTLARSMAMIANLSTVVFAYIITQNQIDFYVFLFPMATMGFFIIRSQGFRTIYNVIFFLIFGFAVLLDVYLADRVLPYQYFVHAALVGFSLLLQILMLTLFVKENTLNSQAISDQQKLLSQAQEIARLGSWIYHVQHDKLEWSEQVYQMLQVDRLQKINLKTDWLKDMPRQWHEFFLFPHGDTFFDFKYSVPVAEEKKWFRVMGKREKDEEGRLNKIFGSIQDITKEVERDEQLTYFVSLSEATIESTRDALVVTDLEGKILNYNSKAVELWQVPESILVKNDAEDINDYLARHFNSSDTFFENRGEIYKDKESIFSGVLHFKDRRIVEYFTQPMQVLGNTAGRVWSFRDITDLHNTAKELEHSEEFYRTILDKAYDGVNIVDEDGTFKYMSPSVQRILGFDVEDYIGKSIYDFVHPKDKGLIKDFFRVVKVNKRLNNGDDTHRSILRFSHKKGGWRIIESISLDLTDNTAIKGIISNFRDITDQVAAEKALIEGEDRFRKLFLDTPLGICIRDVQSGNIIQANKKLSEMYGIKHVRLIGETYSFVAEEDAERQQLIEQLLNGEITSFTLERPFIKNNQERIWCYETNSLISIDKVTYLLSSYLDINKQKNTELALQKSNQRYRSIFENNQLGTVTISDDFRFTDVNPAFCNMLGYSDEELLQMTINDVTNEDDAEKNGQYLEKLKAGEVMGFKMDKKYRHKNGTIVYAQTNFSGIFDKNGKYLEATATIVDITERVESNRQIKELLHQVSQKNIQLEAQSEYLQRSNDDLLRSNQELEQFAYVASHDLQEPLRMVGNFVELLEEEYNEKLDHDGKTYIRFAVDGVTRMSKLIDDLLQYSKIGNSDSQLTKTDIEILVNQKVGDMARYIEQNKAKVVIHDLPNGVLCSSSQISLVFNNLIHNAIKFNHSASPEVHISATQTDTEYIFCVKDNGIGIDQSNHQKIFEIFKRLHRKEEYSGTGIGLALVKRIALRHKGDAWVTSELGKGTSLYFSIAKYLEENN